MKTELTVIICCYNSQEVIPATLEALAKQEPVPFNWDIVLIDNSSTDATSSKAANVWRDLGEPVALRIVVEPKQGLSEARKRGIIENRSPLVIFCDDDNSLCENYITIAKSYMDEHPNIDVCGGLGHPVTDGSFPDWFEKFKAAYAVGSQGKKEGPIQKSYVYGAGIVLRSNVLQQAYSLGFESLLSGRNGGKLSAGDDGEIQEWYFILNKNREVHYVPDLRFQHFLKQDRLTISHLKKLFVGFGEMAPTLDIYKQLRRRNYKAPRLFWFRTLLKFFSIAIYQAIRSRSLLELKLRTIQSWSSIDWLIRNRKMFRRAVKRICWLDQQPKLCTRQN